MKTFAIITSCIVASLLLISPSAFADRPAMSDRGATPLPPPQFMGEETGPMGDSMDEAGLDAPADSMYETGSNTITEPLAEPETMDAESQASSTVETTGDVIEVQPGETMGIRLLEFPRRGMSMDKVKNELGQPMQIAPTVGEPPITSWAYDDRTVYFEYSTVIHVVATK